MLKELWRKLGADFMQADDMASAEGEMRNSGAEGVRVVPHITHTGEFHLERLTHLLKRRYGKTMAVPEHTGVSDHTLKDVIGFAARIQDQDIQRELLLFYLNCSPVIQEFLRSETALGQDRRVKR
ncbi:hypothetical protein [Marinobacter halophilus]|uniref:Uncharacterized protein n=1 Tax=Marinobacter halophilus TaxID=1323740 RepID=A0A2T1K9N1_9GAMM|nr:hypothetical protein [Marinobacter halophilus]PSF06817.1 hypothetical protein C7H08_17225 [Marinobacter halophilus]GGC75797.1 hypothetical protein GCM10011362_25470 [Marinobacter halophilus]